MTADRRPVGLFVAAAVPGFLHAAASLYWGLGGVWLLDTAGQGAVALRRIRRWSPPPSCSRSAAPSGRSRT